jgi:hypothetical protein
MIGPVDAATGRTYTKPAVVPRLEYRAYRASRSASLVIDQNCQNLCGTVISNVKIDMPPRRRRSTVSGRAVAVATEVDSFPTQVAPLATELVTRTRELLYHSSDIRYA